MPEHKYTPQSALRRGVLLYTEATTYRFKPANRPVQAEYWGRNRHARPQNHQPAAGGTV